MQNEVNRGGEKLLKAGAEAIPVSVVLEVSGKVRKNKKFATAVRQQALLEFNGACAHSTKSAPTATTAGGTRRT